MKKQILLLLLTSISLTASEIPSFPFTTVQGEAQRKVKPDCVEVDIDLLAFDKSSDTALQKINQTMKQVLEVLHKSKIDLKTLESTDYYKKAIRNEKDRKKLDILGYQISRDISFKWMQIDNYPSLAAELTKIDGVSRVSSDFTVKDEEEIKLGLVSEACKNAQKKAHILAAGLGVKLGKPYAIKDNDYDSSWNVLFGVAEAYYGGSGDPFGEISSPRLSGFFVPQFISFTVNVDVIYKLETN